MGTFDFLLASFILVCTVFPATIQSQTIRSHKQYKCDDPGDMEGERLKRTIDYARCLNPPKSTRDGVTKVWREEEDICHTCKCELAAYWEIANYCFKQDWEFQQRVKDDKSRFDALWRRYCMPSGVDKDTYPTPVYSTDPNSEFWCGSASKNSMQLRVLIILPFIVGYFMTF